jgi:Holliday junction resolvase RusA-like endonuclease
MQSRLRQNKSECRNPDKAKPWEARRAVETVTLTFDRPPGVNGLFRNLSGVGRVKTTEYKHWVALASQLIALAKPGCVRGPFHMSLTSERDTRGADLDGISKATLDILATMGVIQNDNLEQSRDQQWRGRGSMMRVRITSTRETWHECTL